MADDPNFLLERNRAFARTAARTRVPRIPFIPNEQLYVITCVDPRVDPADILGLQLGDAIVARNVGGRVTPALLQDLAWISFLHETKTPDADWFRIAVIHHTDCGSGLFADDDLRHAFAARGFDDSELSRLAVLDPARTVRADVATLLAYPNLSPRVAVSGYAYDITTGLLTEVVPTRSRADAGTAAVG
jgi:carbonic anhydrase